MTQHHHEQGAPGMPDSDDDDMPNPQAPSKDYIWAMVTSERRRLDKHEQWSADELRSLRSSIEKLDTKFDTRFGSIEETLKRVENILASQAGGKVMLAMLSKPAFWIASAVLSLFFYMMDHDWRLPL